MLRKSALKCINNNEGENKITGKSLHFKRLSFAKRRPFKYLTCSPTEPQAGGEAGEHLHPGFRIELLAHFYALGKAQPRKTKWLAQGHTARSPWSRKQ